MFSRFLKRGAGERRISPWSVRDIRTVKLLPLEKGGIILLITKKYIKLVEKAKEVQKLWRPKEGDRFKFENDSTIFIVSEGRIPDKGQVKGYKIKTLWLPTIEQLIEMWWDKDSALHPKDLFHWFSNVLKIYEDYFYLFLSPEELWFAVIMKENYNKIWINGNWVKEGK